MTLSSSFLELIVCPKCKGRLEYLNEAEILNCARCVLSYPVREGMPILLEDEAMSTKQGDLNVAKSQKIVAFFKVKEGANKGQEIEVPLGHCKAIGRSVEDLNKTQMVHLDATLSLDDFTKKVVLNYLAKKTGKEPVLTSKDKNQLGSFKRLPDIVLTDPAVSRLHAMLFLDETGAGILDLVSRNGTYVNGQEVESKTLKEGDLIEIGGTQITFNFLKKS